MRFYLILASLAAVLCWGCNRGGEPSPAANSQDVAPAPTVVAKPIVSDAGDAAQTTGQSNPAADEKKTSPAEEKKTPPADLEPPAMPPLFKLNEGAPAKLDETTKEEVKKEAPPPVVAPAETTPPAEPAKPELAVAVQENGEPALVVKFPWKEFARPSLQLTFAGDTPPTPMVVSGSALTELFGTLVGKLNKPVHPGATQSLQRAVWFAEHDNGKPLRIFGTTNALGRAAAFGLDDHAQVALVFYLLDSWADPDGALRIALSDLAPVAKYAESGKLQVWFLNEEKVVWGQSIAWPGKAKPQAEPVATPAIPSPGKPAEEKKTTAGEQKPGGFDPFWKPPAKSAAPQAGAVIAPPPVAPPIAPPAAETKPAPTEIKPPAAEPAKPKPVKTDIKEMTVEEAAQYIDQTWSKSMSPRVLKIWRGGMANYFQVDNPEAVRVDVFLTLVRNCYDEQPPGELRNAFVVLYQKLRQQIPKK